ncbi:2-oxo acid dehydrogenase subunit E2, partial [Lactobacillus sp. XV13L]|nr:2-oxo acid dehydrogenase subunit E2 [Lactobacillus sp. XV13L]
RDKGIDLSQVAPSGKHGQITKADVDNFNVAAAPATNVAPAASVSEPAATPIAPYKSDTPELETREKMSMTRKVIAKAMSESKKITPHVTSFDEVEVSALMANRKKYKQIAADRGIKLTFLPYLVKAIVAVLKEFPEFNASIDSTTNEIVYK